jgi:3-dehydroquinate synthase
VARHFAAVGMKSALAELRLDCDGRDLTAHMLHDKKMDAGRLPFLLMRGIGQTFLASDVDLHKIAAFLDGELAR